MTKMGFCLSYSDKLAERIFVLNMANWSWGPSKNQNRELFLICWNFLHQKLCFLLKYLRHLSWNKDNSTTVVKAKRPVVMNCRLCQAVNLFKKSFGPKMLHLTQLKHFLAKTFFILIYCWSESTIHYHRPLCPYVGCWRVLGSWKVS